MRRVLAVALLAFACHAQAQPTQPLTMRQIMADPDWIGPGVEDAWWRWDGRAIDFNLKRDGENIRHLNCQAARRGKPFVFVTGGQ